MYQRGRCARCTPGTRCGSLDIRQTYLDLFQRHTITRLDYKLSYLPLIKHIRRATSAKLFTISLFEFRMLCKCCSVLNHMSCQLGFGSYKVLLEFTKSTIRCRVRIAVMSELVRIRHTLQTHGGGYRGYDRYQANKKILLLLFLN